MDMKHGIKRLVLPMDSSFTGALKESAASNDSIFTCTSNCWLSVNALLALRQTTKEEHREGNTTIFVLLFSLPL